MTSPTIGAAAPTPLLPGGPAAPAGGAVATAAVSVAASGRNVLRLQGVVVAAAEGGPLVEFPGGRVVQIEGASALRPMSRVEVQLPSGRLPDGEAVNAQLLPEGGGGDPGNGAVPVRLRPAPTAPTLLPARPGPALPATLALADGSGSPVEVRLAVAPFGTMADVPSPAERAATLAAALGALAAGTSLPASVEPRRGTERAATLDLGAGLVARLGRDAAGGLHEGGTVLVRLVGTAVPGGGDLASALERALAEGPVSRGDAEGADRLPADAPRLGARLQALADRLDRDSGSGGLDRAEQVGGAMAVAAQAVLGDGNEPATLRLARERDADGGDAGADEAGSRLVLDVAFARLGRFRLEIDRLGGSGAELRIALRGERPLPAGAHAELVDRVGAAFEIGGAKARFVVSTGGLPSPPARSVVA